MTIRLYEQSTTLYQLSTSGKVKEWTISVVDNVIKTVWGYVDGVKQETTDIISGKNVGRANETSDSEQAALEYDRKIKEKKHLGSVESLSAAQNSKRTIDDDFFNDPPESLCMPKPINTISDKKKYGSKFIVQRKLDGCRAHVFIGTNGNVCIKSRTMKEDKTLHFPDIVAQFKSLGITNTVFDGEMVAFDSAGQVDDFDKMTSIWRSDVEKSLVKSSGANVVFVVFDMPFFEGDDMLASVKYSDRQQRAASLIGKINRPGIQIMQNLDATVKEAEGMARKNGWEGLVLWNPDAVHENAWTINGKPKRPSGFCYKDKVKQDFDLVVDTWEYGKGKNKDSLGKWINAYMICPKTGKKIKVCDVGGGLSDEQRHEFMSLEYPIVIKVECDKMTTDGSLRFPVFKSIHEGKTPEECIMEKSVMDRLSEVRYL